MNNILILDQEEFLQILDNKLGNISRGEKPTPKKWLRSADVREMLNISDSTLQTMRINETIPAYKLGTTWFYKYEEIIEALEKSKTKGGRDAE